MAVQYASVCIHTSHLQAAEGEIRIRVQPEDLRALLSGELLNYFPVVIDVRAARHCVANPHLGVCVQLVVRYQNAL